MADSLPTRQQDFNEWYNQLVLRADNAAPCSIAGKNSVGPTDRHGGPDMAPKPPGARSAPA